VTIDCSCIAWALAALPHSRLAAGFADRKVRIVDADTGSVVAILSGHSSRVTALAVLPDGRLASGSSDRSVRVWNVAARECVATLTGHTGEVWSLAALPGGRLASMAAYEATVRLWDVGARACVGMLDAQPSWPLAALVALPDGRLATGSEDGTIRLWDTRPEAAVAAAGSSHAAGAVPVAVVGELGGSGTVLGTIRRLVALPDGRLACGIDSGSPTVYLLEIPPPAAYE